MNCWQRVRLSGGGRMYIILVHCHCWDLLRIWSCKQSPRVSPKVFCEGAPLPQTLWQSWKKSKIAQDEKHCVRVNSWEVNHSNCSYHCLYHGIKVQTQSLKHTHGNTHEGRKPTQKLQLTASTSPGIFCWVPQVSVWCFSLHVQTSANLCSARSCRRMSAWLAQSVSAG